MPPPSAIIHDPALASLTYHKRVNFDIIRGIGYDLWADSRFDYRTGLEFTLVPIKGASTEDQLCAKAMALRIALPADDAAQRKLGAFVRGASAGTKIDPEKVLSRLAGRMTSGEKYGEILKEYGIAVEGGKVIHPTRGEFFVAAFDWSPR